MRYLDGGMAKRVSKVGLGTWQFGNRLWGYGPDYSEREAYAIVRRAVELGVTLFDTAETYAEGRSERILGRALGEDREAVVIADKIFPVVPSASLVRWRAAASARRLGVPRLDLYQVHYPSPLVSDRVLMRGMRLSRRAGLVSEVGVSNYTVARWRAAEAALGARIVSNQVPYSLLSRAPEIDVLPFAREHDRIVIAFSPLAQGLLSGRYHGSGRPGDEVRTTSPYFRPDSFERTGPLMAVLREVADAHSATPAQIALAWVIRHPAVAAIPGASSQEQLERNVAAAEITLADDEYQALSAASAWSRENGSPPRRRLGALRHCAGGGRRVARTVWQDLKSRG